MRILLVREDGTKVFLEDDCKPTFPIKILGETWEPKKEKAKISKIREGFKRLGGNIGD